MKNWRRFEILPPLRYNSGQPVPRPLLATTLLELENRFGAVPSETPHRFPITPPPYLSINPPIHQSTNPSIH